MEREEFNEQVQQENVKHNIVGFLKSSLHNIYIVCSKKCLTNFDYNDLSDKEKICLSKCFDRKNETFQISIDMINKYSQRVEELKNPAPIQSFKLE